jgi:hypothetical protein
MQESIVPKLSVLEVERGAEQKAGLDCLFSWC